MMTEAEAKKKWCERHAGGGHKYVNVCPPEVVAALLNLRDVAAIRHGGAIHVGNRCEECLAVDAADAAITRALEGKI